MNKELRRLVSLDPLRGFEAASRLLSFTSAAAELHVTQSAVSRQIAALEEQIGVKLFYRRNRSLALTDAGKRLQAGVAAALKGLDDAVQSVSAQRASHALNVTASVAVSALWLIPRLPRFRQRHPEVDVRISASSAVVDLEAGEFDLALRFCALEQAPAGAIYLFGEEVVPVCSPKLLKDRARPLRRPEDLRHHVLLHYEDPLRPMPWHAWPTWLETVGLADLKPAGSLRFSHLDHAIRAAVGGQGVALGIRGLIEDLLRDRSLVIPFPRATQSNRAYHIVLPRNAAARPEVSRFVQWLQEEAAGADITRAGERDRRSARRSPNARPRAR
jgi:LysR family transcriptional regulator, glycine cleavage system transcriptional activator